MLKRSLSFLYNSFTQSKFITRRDSYQSLQILIEHKSSPVQIKSQISNYQNIQISKKTNSIWIYLNNINLQHTGLLVNQLGYKIHHGKNNNIVLYKWLSSKSDLVPPYSSFYLSCGALIIHNDHVLLVQQGNGPRKGLFGIPGGRSDVGQFLQKTAQRQLFQQTGINAKFQHFIYFRYMENTVFGADDLYFVCLMKPQQQILNKIKLCDRQLASFQWVHLSKLADFVNQKSVGTQKQVGNYITELYNKGYKFQLSKKQDFPNLSNQNFFTAAKDGIKRKFMEYKFINPNHLQIFTQN